MNNLIRPKKFYSVMTYITILIISSVLNGVISVEFNIPNRLNERMSDSCGYNNCPQTSPGVLNVHIVPHTHYELGSQRTFQEHYFNTEDTIPRSDINMKETLDHIITELWTNKDRTFSLSDIAYFFRWWSQQGIPVRRKVRQLLKEGRFVFIGGGWSMNDEATTSYHAIIESFTYSLRKINSTFYNCGRPLVAWQSDVKGHTREFASLIALMGFDGLFISPISIGDELVRMRRKALEFLWRGSDDLGPVSDIFTHKLFDGHWAPPNFCFSTDCSDPLVVSSDKAETNSDERASMFEKSMLGRQAPHYNTSHVMVTMGPVLGRGDAAMWFANIDRLIEAVHNRSTAKIKLFYSSPACYLQAVYQAKPLLEPKQDDFLPVAYDENTYHTGFYTSRPSMKLLVREGLVYLQMTKQMQVLGRLTGDKKLYEKYMWAFGVFLDHSIITGSLADHVKEYYVNKLYVVIQKATMILRKVWNFLRNSPQDTLYYRCSFNVSSCHICHSNNSFLMIYNPLAWPVSLPVRLPVMYPGQFEVYTPLWTKVKIGFVRLPNPVIQLKGRTYMADYELVFMAEDVPPLGYRSYFIKNAREEEGKIRSKRALTRHMNRFYARKYLNSIDNPSIREAFKLLSEADDTDYGLESAFQETTKNSVNQPIDYGDYSKLSVFDLFRFKPILENVQKYDMKLDRKVTKSTTANTIDYTASFDALSVPTTELQYAFIENWMSDVMEDIIRDKYDAYKNSLNFKEDDVITQTAKPIAKINNTFPTTSETTTTTTATDSIITTTKNSTSEKSIRPIYATSFSTSTAKTIPVPNLTITKKKNKILLWSRKKMATDEQSTDTYIRNKYMRINLDPVTRKIVDVVLANGIRVNLDIQYYYYVSEDPVGVKKNIKRPGASVFRSLDNTPVIILENLQVKVYKMPVGEEVQYVFSDWASLVVRLYAESPVIEVDWLVGPVPLGDNLRESGGKEVFISYITDLETESAFYTDSNGRQTVRRMRNMRPMFEPLNTDPVAGNYYPVTSKIYIEDFYKNIRFSLFTDRAQGGASLSDGTLDMMVHRRILTSDTNPNIYLNDTEFGEGAVIRGKHWIHISKADHNPYRVFEKKFAKEIELQPQILVSSPDPYKKQTKDLWLQHINEYSFIKNKLPRGIHLLTLESWNEGTLLLRLENYLEKSDIRIPGAMVVYIRELFTNIVIDKVEETTLAGNIWMKDYVDYTTFKWQNKDPFVNNFNENYMTREKVKLLPEEFPLRYRQVDFQRGITLKPQQIRTFVCWFHYVDNF